MAKVTAYVITKLAITATAMYCLIDACIGNIENYTRDVAGACIFTVMAAALWYLECEVLYSQKRD